MGLGVGDVIFQQNGRPAVIQKRDEETGNLTVETKGQAYESRRKAGFVNGLKGTDRQSYDSIIQESKKIKEPVQRVQFLQDQITKLKDEPGKNNLQLTRYLENEVGHLINSEGIQPRTFEIPNPGT